MIKIRQKSLNIKREPNEVVKVELKMYLNKFIKKQ